ncbi:hypothetical protein HFN89_06900 [Rhizobium laguerreae]|nr:hypothetical protein [Rhizobium laguerreae]
MKRALISGIALAAATTFAGLAHAEMAPGGKPHDRPGIQAMDLDKNGKVTREEFEDGGHDRAEKTFSKLDANGDGSISKEEFLAGGPDRARVFKRLDRNRDGVIDRNDRPERHGQGDGRPGEGPDGHAQPPLPPPAN